MDSPSAQGAKGVGFGSISIPTTRYVCEFNGYYEITSAGEMILQDYSVSKYIIFKRRLSMNIKDKITLILAVVAIFVALFVAVFSDALAGFGNRLLENEFRTIYYENNGDFDIDVFGTETLEDIEITSVVEGMRHSIVLDTDNTLWAWGDNGNGQLGDGTTENRYVPTEILGSVVDISAGSAHTIAILEDGSLWAWGDNSNGQLGDGTTESRYLPTRILNSVVAASAGSAHTVAILEDGSLWAWGNNFQGQLGDGTTINRYSPVRIMSDVTFVTTGGHHTMAIRTDDSLWSWGNNSMGQLGNGARGNLIIYPNPDPKTIMDNVATVSTGLNHTMAIRTDGSLWAWGDNRYGQFGFVYGASIPAMTPYSSYPVRILMPSISTVSVGANHTVAIREDGRLLTWGNNRDGQLGNGTTHNQHIPIEILDEAVAVSTGFSRTMAILEDGILYAWGRNTDGRIGIDLPGNILLPIRITITREN